MSLSQFVGKRIALILDIKGDEIVLRGTTSLRHDGTQGRMLRVRVSDDEAYGNPVFLISEDKWTRWIAADDHFGCDFRLNLASQAPRTTRATG